MSARSGGRTKKRGHSMTLAPGGSPLICRPIKRAGKSPGPVSPGPSGHKGAAAAALATDESDIVLDRLGKEIVTLLRAGGAKKTAARERLRLGINEVTKFLEAVAAALLKTSPDPSPSSPSSSGSKPSSSASLRLSSHGGAPTSMGGRSGGRGPCRAGEEPAARREIPLASRPNPPVAPAAIVLICRDVRPSRLVEHIHALVALTGTPHLVLSGSSSSLGGVFGCKTMAALAICPARPPPPPRPSPTPPALSRPCRSAISPDGVEGVTAQQSLKNSGRGSTGSASASASGSGNTGCFLKSDRKEAENGDGRGGGGRRGSGSRSNSSITEPRGLEGVKDAGGTVVAPAVSDDDGRGGAQHDKQDGGSGPTTEARGAPHGLRATGAAKEGGVVFGDGSGGGKGVPPEDRAVVDEDVDSFIAFLRKKVRVLPSSTA